MKNLKFLMFTLIAVFTIGFCFNVNAAQEISEDTTLTEDISDGVVIPEGKTVTLNLGGKTITAPSEEVAITNNGTLTIEGEGSVIANGDYAVSNHGVKLTINGGSYSKVNPDATQSLIANGWYNASDNTTGAYSEMVINGGTFDGGSYTTIKNDSYGNMIINGGTFTSTITSGGIQEAGKDLTIKGGEFNLPIWVQNLASVNGEAKTTKILGGTFNKEVKAAPYNGTATKASNVDVYIGENAKFNSNLNVTNTYSPADTLAFLIKQFDVREIGGSLTIGGTSSIKYPSVTLDGFTIGGGLTLSYVEPSVIKNTVIRGTESKSGDVELINVTANQYTSNAKNATIKVLNNTKIDTIKTTTNTGCSIIVDGATVDKIFTNGNNKLSGYDSITIKNGSVGTITATKGTTTLESGKIDNFIIENKLTANIITLNVSNNAVIKQINNLRDDEASYSINLPDGYQVNEETGNVTMPISNAVVTLEKDSYVYTGSEFKPEVTLVKYGEFDLVKETDYTVTYENNTNVGTATVTITGKGNYTGTLERKFNITKKDISSYKVVPISSKVYNTRKQEPLVSVNGLTKNDYDVTYKNNINVGTATVIITGKGNYTGTIKNVTFKITKANNPMAVKAVNKKVKAKKVKKKKQVVKDAVVTTKAQGTVTYAKVSGNKKFTVDKKTGKITVKKKTKKGTYKIKVKVTAAGNKNYKAASKTVTIKIRVK